MGVICVDQLKLEMNDLYFFDCTNIKFGITKASFFFFENMLNLFFLLYPLNNVHAELSVMHKLDRCQ
jgi:hypothetical protein